MSDFTLKSLELLDLVRFLHDLENGGFQLPPTIHQLRWRIATRVVPTPSEIVMQALFPSLCITPVAGGVRFNPYPPPQPPGGPAKPQGACVRGGKTLRPSARSWQEVVDPFYERDAKARQFLGGIVYNAQTTQGTAAGEAWLRGLAEGFHNNAGFPGEHSDFTLHAVVLRCAELGKTTTVRLFRQALAQIELAKTLDA